MEVLIAQSPISAMGYLKMKETDEQLRQEMCT